MKNRIIAIFLFFMLLATVYADNYRVHRIFGRGDITIAGKKAYEGMIFSDVSIIFCTAQKTGMEVINEDKQGRNIQDYLVFSTFITKGADMSLKEYRKLYDTYEETKIRQKFPRRSLSSKGFSDNERRIFLLQDSFSIVNNGNINNNTFYEAVWRDDGKEVRSPLSISKDLKEIIITPAVYEGREPRFVEMRIEATDELGGPYLVRTIWIEPLTY